MFGYFKLDKECPAGLQTEYRRYYCFLCRAIEKYYGQKARFLLSFDVTFFMILVSDDSYLKSVSRISCFNHSKEIDEVLSRDFTGKIASLNILLTAAKLEDDIQDEGSIKSKLANGLFNAEIRKAKQHDPRMWEIISENYQTIRRLESEGAGLKEIEQAFSKLMTEVAALCFGLTDPARLSQLNAASRWLYYIDAVDDIDENRAEKTFNPLYEYSDFADLKEHYYELSEHINALLSETVPNASRTMNDALVNRVIYCGIPDATINVIMKRRKT